MNRIPSLDGFRAISIILVLIAHSRYTEGFPPGYEDIARHGAVGVTVFFVISGFLITTLLLNEDSKNGNINIKGFYLRRAFRILPVFLIYILFILTLGKVQLSNNDIIHTFSFTVNFAPGNRSWYIAHFWTLSIEEQFYIIWPAVFIFCRKYLKPVLCILIAYSCISRVIAYKFPAYASLFLAPYFSASDAIMIGALGAIILFENPYIIKLKMFDTYILQVVAVCIISLFTYFSGYGKAGKIALPFGNIIISCAILFLVLAYIKPVNNLIYKFLNHKVIVHIGILSYSIYVWQQFFLSGISDISWKVFPYNIIVVYLISLTSYYLLEQPILSLKKYFVFSVANKKVPTRFQ